MGATALGLLAALLAPAAPRAEQIPFRRFDVRDGLAHSRVTSVVQDPLGYLWFGTWEGISRFDGYQFDNFGPAQNIDPPIVFEMACHADGRIFAALWGGGVVRSAGIGGTDADVGFTRFRLASDVESNRVYDLALDSGDSLWCLTMGGLYRAASAAGPAPEFERLDLVPLASAIEADPLGGLWIGVGGALLERRAGQWNRLREPAGVDTSAIISIDWIGDGNLLILRERDAQVLHAGRGYWTSLAVPLRPGQRIQCGVRDRSGRYWIGTTRGLLRKDAGGWTTLTMSQGLSDDYVRSLFADREGNVWIGTNQIGVCRFSGERIVAYTRFQGSPDREALKVVQSLDGAIYATTAGDGILRIGERENTIVPGSNRHPFASLDYRLVQDTRGDWWIGCPEGALRFKGPELKLTDDARLPLPGAPGGESMIAVTCDPATGAIWFGSQRRLYRAAPDDSAPDGIAWTDFGEVPGVSGVRKILPLRSGELWIAGFEGIARMREGKMEAIGASAGLPNTDARSLFEDRDGRLWIGHRFGGVSVTADPGADQPEFANLDSSKGLSSGTVWSIAADSAGFIYLGTGRGLNRLDPDLRRITHFTTSDGLAGETVHFCDRLRDGRVWLATSGGVCRFSPDHEDTQGPPPPIYIKRIQVEGEEVDLHGGEPARIGQIVVPPDRNFLSVEFVGLYFRGDHPLRYEYRLEGGMEDWSPPTEQRSMQYARLAPGRYRLFARAVAPDGSRSSVPAEISFEVLRPFWQQAWFLALGALLLGSAGVGLHRLRTRHLIAMERIRGQIALDLHDDVGSGLSEIAVLTEVARRQAHAADGAHLEQTAELARALREKMSDIVWSVDPRRDSLVDLIRRMRQTAMNLLEAGGIDVEFTAPGEKVVDRVGLTPDRRRHLFLIFKEMLANVARHARASRVRIQVEIDHDAVRLTVDDDGVGFESKENREGHGLRSLEARARALGGRCVVSSTLGRGTRISVTAPLRRSPRASLPRIFMRLQRGRSSGQHAAKRKESSR